MLTTDKPILNCQMCGVDIDPEPIIVENIEMYVKLKIAICVGCGEKVEEGRLIDATNKRNAEIKRRLKNFENYATIVGLPFTSAHAGDFSEQDKEMCREIYMGLKACKSYTVVSDCGIGKSYYVSFVFSNLLRENILSYEQLSYIRMRDTLLDIRRTYSEDVDVSEVAIINKHRHKRYLAIEITDHQTVVNRSKKKFESDVLFDFVDLRYRNWKSLHRNTATVFISTVDIGNLSQVYDESVVSRIVEMSDRIFKIKGTNRRYKGKDDKIRIIKNE